MKRALCISLFAALGLALFKPALAQVVISVNFAPPALPEYEQPQCPDEGNIWVPGYWAWDDDYEDYYWVPGTWVPAPEPGYLWTPPYWGWNNGAYVFNQGYWAPQVGFYGGIDYGYGYSGRGFDGGRWRDNHFYYNTAVMNVNTTVIRNVYVDKTVIVNNHQHVSFNGGQGGIQARPTQQEETVAHMRHAPPPAAQEQRIQMARSNPQFRASANHGKPPVAATQRPTEFSGRGVVQARAAGAPYHPPANRPAARDTNAGPGKQNTRPGDERTPTTAKPTARPETHETPSRPAPEQRQAPAARTQQQERQMTRPETAPKPTERPAPPSEQQRPAPESRPAPPPRQERPAPRTEQPHQQEQRPAPRANPQSKPKPEEKKRPE